MLTALSRDCGAWMQPGCVNTSSEYYEPLPRISQDVQHHSHRATGKPRARSAPVKMSATGGGQINMPKTFLTRSGALLLFAAQNDPSQIPTQQLPQRKLSRRNVLGQSLEFKTVEGLQRAILQYGIRDSDVNLITGVKKENYYVLDLKKLKLQSHPPSQAGEPLEFYLENLRKMTNTKEQTAGRMYQTQSAELQEILQDFHQTLTDVRQGGRQKTWPLTSGESLSSVRQSFDVTAGDTTSRSPPVNRTTSARSFSASKTAKSTGAISPKLKNVSNQPATLNKRPQGGQHVEEANNLRVKENGWSPSFETGINESIFRVEMTEKPESASIKPRQKKVLGTKETRQTNCLDVKYQASTDSMGMNLGPSSDSLNDIPISDSLKDIQETFSDSIKDRNEILPDSLKDKQQTLSDISLAKQKTGSVVMRIKQEAVSGGMHKPVDTTVTEMKVDIIQREVTSSAILTRSGSRVEDNNKDQFRLTQNDSFDSLNFLPPNVGQVALADECIELKESEESKETVHIDKSEVWLQSEEIWLHKGDSVELGSPQNQAREDYQSFLDKNETLGHGDVGSNLVLLSDQQDVKVVLACSPEEKVVPACSPEEKVVPACSPEEKFVPACSPEEKVVPACSPEGKVVKTSRQEEKVVQTSTQEEKIVQTYLPDEIVLHTSLQEEKVVQKYLPEDKVVHTSLQEEKVIQTTLNSRTQVDGILQTSLRHNTKEKKVLQTYLQNEDLQTSCDGVIQMKQGPPTFLQLGKDQELQDETETNDRVIQPHVSPVGGYFRNGKDFVELDVEELQKLHSGLSESYSSMGSAEDSESLTVSLDDSGNPNVTKTNSELSAENLCQGGNTEPSKRQDGKVEVSHSQKVGIELPQNLKSVQKNQEEILQITALLLESSGQQWNDNVENMQELITISKEDEAAVLSEKSADVDISATIDSGTFFDDADYELSSEIDVINADTGDLGYILVREIQEKNTHGDEVNVGMVCAEDNLPMIPKLQTISTDSSNITETSNYLLPVGKETETSFNTELQGTNDDRVKDPQMHHTEDKQGQLNHTEGRHVHMSQAADKQAQLNQTEESQEQIYDTKDRQVQIHETEDGPGQAAAICTRSGVGTTRRQQEQKLQPTQKTVSSSAKKGKSLGGKNEIISNRNTTSNQSVAMSDKNTSRKKSSVVKQTAVTNLYLNSAQSLGNLITPEILYKESLQNEATMSLEVTQEEAPLIRVQSYATQHHPGIRSHQNITPAQKQTYVPPHLKEITTRTTDLQTYNEFEAEIRKIEHVLVDDLLGKDAQLLDESEGLSAEDFVLARESLMARIKQAEEWLQTGFHTQELGRARSQHTKKRKIPKKEKALEKAKLDELAKENEAIREYHRLEKQIRLDKIRDLTDKITVCEEFRKTQEAETNAKLEELAEEIETLKQEEEEIFKTEADARTQVAALRKAKREERAKNRKIELENKRKAAIERRAKEKTMKEADLEKELDKLSKLVEEEVVSRHRDEEEAKLEEEEIAALEKLEVDMLGAEKAADDEEVRLVFLEKQAEEEAFLHLVTEKEATEKRRKDTEEQVRIVRQEHERIKQNLLDEMKQLSDEILIHQDEEEQLRLQKVNRVRELQRAEQEARASLLAALEQKRITALRRREHNLGIRDNRDAICHSQEITGPWTFSYFVKWTYALNQRLLEQNKKKQKRTVSAKMSASSKTLNAGVNASVK